MMFLEIKYAFCHNTVLSLPTWDLYSDLEFRVNVCKKPTLLNRLLCAKKIESHCLSSLLVITYQIKTIYERKFVRFPGNGKIVFNSRGMRLLVKPND